MKDRQGGFAALELLILVPLVIVLAVVATKVYQTGHKTPTTANNTTTQPTSNTIQTSNDLDQAGQELDQVNVDAGATAESDLAAQAATF